MGRGGSSALSYFLKGLGAVRHFVFLLLHWRLFLACPPLKPGEMWTWTTQGHLIQRPLPNLTKTTDSPLPRPN